MRHKDLVETLKQIAFEKNTEAKEDDEETEKKTKVKKTKSDEIVLNPVINTISNAR